MKLILVLVVFLNGFSLGLLSNLCENEACSEFVKESRDLHETKLKETEKVSVKILLSFHDFINGLICVFS